MRRRGPSPSSRNGGVRPSSLQVLVCRCVGTDVRAPLTLFAIGVGLAAMVLGLDAVGGIDVVLFAAPALTLAATLLSGVYVGEEGIARLRERRAVRSRPRPQRAVAPTLRRVVAPAGAYLRTLPRRGPPGTLAAA